jgi:hypothetical protein
MAEITEESEWNAVRTLKACSVISILLGIAAAITVWITMGWQYQAGSRVSTEANPAGIALGAIILFGGIVQYAVLILIASMAENLRAISRTNFKLLDIIETQQKPKRPTD